MDNLQRGRTDGGQAARPVVDVLAAPLRLQTYRNLLYLFSRFPLGIAYFVTLVVVGSVAAGAGVILTEALPSVLGSAASAGAALLPLLVAVPILLVVAVVLLAVGLCGVAFGGVALFTVDRSLTGLLLGRSFPTAPVAGSPLADPLGFLRRFLTTPGTYLAGLVVLATFPLGIGLFVALVVAFAFSVALLAAPLLYDDATTSIQFQLPEGLELSYVDGFYTVDAGVVVQSGTWTVETLPEALFVALGGLLLLVVSLNVFNLVAWALGEATAVVARHASVFTLPDDT